jgi:hypothetical protein
VKYDFLVWLAPVCNVQVLARIIPAVKFINVLQSVLRLYLVRPGFHDFEEIFLLKTVSEGALHKCGHSINV